MLASSHLTLSVSSGVRQRGALIHASGNVKIIQGDGEHVDAVVHGSRPYGVTLQRQDDEVYAHCDCPYFESSGLCKHVWSVVLAAERKGHLKGTTGRRANLLVENWDAEEDIESDDGEDDDRPFALESPRFQARRDYARVPAQPPQWQRLLQQLPVAIPAASNGWPAGRELYYVLSWTQAQRSTAFQLEILYREPKKNGDWGKLKGTRIPRDVIAEMPSELDREILLMLGGTPLEYDWSPRDTIPYAYRVEGRTASMLLEKICATGRCLRRRERDEAVEGMERVSFDTGAAWQFQLRIGRAGESWLVSGEFARLADRLDIDDVEALLPAGVMYARATVARFRDPAALNWWSVLRRNGPIAVPVHDADSFLQQMLDRSELPPVRWPEDLQFSETTPEPQPRLRMDPRRSRGEGLFCAYASFRYDGLDLAASDRRSGYFDPARRVLVRRNTAAEQKRIQELESLGFKEASDRYEADSHHHLPAKKLALAVRDLTRSGWYVEIEGRAFRKPAKYTTELTSGVDWFELRTVVDYDGAVAQLPDLLKAIKQKSGLVELSDGSLGVVPEDLLQSLAAVIATGKTNGDHVRFSRSQTTLLDALLATRPEINVDETFVRAREHLRSFQKIQPACQPGGFTGTLRGYQCEGLAWMRFLQDLGFGGCLADDMGLGKTAQILALLEQRREMREKGEDIKPSLAVVPRSLIFNWLQEARRFTPQLRVLDHSGIERNRREGTFSGFDLILATYGTIRRDIARLQDVTFDYAILDEAQAIKNGDSDSAKAVRLINARHRLALSGTPIQNHLGDLYSLFEFLNPGMLGSVRAFSTAGLSVRDPDQATREMLALAVRPFLLRRTKDQVAQELPERTEQTIYCELDTAERKQYDELRRHYRSVLMGRVEQDGMAKSQMHILEALLRLRQAACHPGLLDPKRVQASSAKIDSLLANLREVISEGHKALVFSQFTSLLSIVRASLDKGTSYEYLDGRTRDREARVQRFQTDVDCKLFLISLKAGGVGLNLTAADYVFLLDPWWNPAVEAQAIDRTHRIGQTSHVFAYRLIAKDTVEEKVLELQGRKRSLADSIIRADASLVSSLKREDLEFLLS